MVASFQNIHTLRENIKKELHGLYSSREINSLIEILFKHRFGMQRHEIGLNKLQKLANKDKVWFNDALARIRDHYPVQYLIGWTEFYGIPIKIVPGVLIPRQETEELVDWIIRDNRRSNPRILDIGTGSGCIALALKKNIPGSSVVATDIEDASLSLAAENFNLTGLKVHLEKHDIRSVDTPARIGKMDIIVSNPPYIPESEKGGLDRNVADYEPGSALFVPDRNPLIYYRHLASFSRVNLNSGGALFVEIHERFGMQVKELMIHEGFSGIIVNKDIHGKNRMVKGIIE